MKKKIDLSAQPGLNQYVVSTSLLQLTTDGGMMIPSPPPPPFSHFGLTFNLVEQTSQSLIYVINSVR